MNDQDLKGPSRPKPASVEIRFVSAEGFTPVRVETRLDAFLSRRMTPHCRLRRRMNRSERQCVGPVDNRPQVNNLPYCTATVIPG